MYEAMDKSYVMQTYPRNYVNFKKGENATLFDENGKDYIDFTSGIGVVSVGHGNLRLAHALFDQASNLIHTSNLFLIEPQAKLAKRMCELSGYDMAVFFANSGAEANEGAIKLARKYGLQTFPKKRFKVLTLEHSFHGRTITTVKATGQTSFHKEAFAPYPEGFSFHEQIRALIEAIDEETVAVMIELVQGEGGVQPLDKAAVQELAAFLKERQLLLIIDEVQTGVFRSGEFLASQLYGITPDIITLAKGLAGGVPIGAIMTTHKTLFEVGDHGSTFGGNFLSTRAGLEVLDILESYKQSGLLDEAFLFFEAQLRRIAQAYPQYFEKELGLGLMRGLRCKGEETLPHLIKSAFEAGVLVLRSGRNTLRFLPPLTISKEEIQEGFRRLEDAIATLS